MSPRPAGSGPAVTRPVQLRWLAHARSGDKGNTANVGLIALEPDFYPILAKEVTVARVVRHFRGMVSGVERFELPNLGALNFLLHGALGGGGTISLKTDAQGKVYSTALLRMEIPVPATLARQVARQVERGSGGAGGAARSRSRAPGSPGVGRGAGASRARKVSKKASSSERARSSRRTKPAKRSARSKPAARR
jgi:hypothetical protein